MGPPVGQGGGRGGHVPGDVLGQVQVVDRHPAGVDHVDEHQGVVAGEMDVDVVRRVVGAMPGQLHPLPAGLQGVPVGEGHLRRRAGRVVVAEQQPAGLLVPDPDHVPAEQRRRAGVVGVVVGVDQVRHLVGHAGGGGDLVHRQPQVPADSRRRVEHHHAVAGGQERRLVDPVGHPVQVPLHPAHVIPLLVQGRAQRGPRDRRVPGQVRGAAGAVSWCSHGISLESPGISGRGGASVRDEPRIAASQVKGRHRILVIHAPCRPSSKRCTPAGSLR
jgi:hypothetical protein